MDAGIATHHDINGLERRGCRVYAPITNEKQKLAAGHDPYAPGKHDGKGVVAWLDRMGTDNAKLIYSLRSQSAEWMNVQCRNYGLRNILVRGRERCLSVALLHALTQNLLTGMRLKGA